MFLIRRIVEKIKHAHTYDNSELDDLFTDILTRKPLTTIQKLKRKVLYAFKTLIYFITTFAVIVATEAKAFASIYPSSEHNDWEPMLLLLGFFMLAFISMLIGTWYSSRYENTSYRNPTHRMTIKELDDPYIPPPLPRKTYKP